MRKINFKSWQFWLKVSLILVVIAGGIAGVLLIKKYRVEAPTTKSALIIDTSSPTPATPPAAAKAAIKSAPPKKDASGTTTTKTNSDGSKTVTVSEGTTSSSDTSLALAAGPSGSISGIDYIDETSLHPDLGNQLKAFMSSNLLVKGEVNYLYAIILKNAGDTGWAGLYSGQYNQSPSGQITSAWGYITLNSYYYEGNPYFTDYMKLILSHEYGHHYSLYYKWMVWQLPSGTRFPDSYYSVRPLPYSGTAADYSLGWGNCDCEIVAEDYSYLFSGYGVSQVAATWGYPSAATKTWFEDEPSGSGGSPTPTPSVSATPTPSASASPSNSPTADTTNPTVTFTDPSDNPHSWTGGNLHIGVTASDNVAVQKIEIYINGQLVLTQNASSVSAVWAYSNAPAGTYTMTAKAYDTSNNTASTSITINKS